MVGPGGYQQSQRSANLFCHSDVLGPEKHGGYLYSAASTTRSTSLSAPQYDDSSSHLLLLRNTLAEKGLCGRRILPKVRDSACPFGKGA
jgi:hypothetical protein